MKYELVEVSYDEHLALYEAGVWVQWQWYSYTNCDVPAKTILSRRSEIHDPRWELQKEICYKFYTRVLEADDGGLQTG